MTLFEELTWRGFVNQVTHPKLAQLLEKERLTLYCGFDPSADSLHVGSLLPILGLAHFQRYGHKPIVLVGGGTGLVGDPSGKVQERQLPTKEAIEANLAGIRAQLERFVSFEGENAAVMMNNADWLCALPLLDFLRDIGKHFSVNVMLGKESVRQRVSDRDYGMSFTEFSYSLLQAYDFLHLYDVAGCRLQVGGRIRTAIPQNLDNSHPAGQGEVVLGLGRQDPQPRSIFTIAWQTVQYGLSPDCQPHVCTPLSHTPHRPQ